LAVTALAWSGAAQAAHPEPATGDPDSIGRITKVMLSSSQDACSLALNPPAPAKPLFTPTFFSFDISEVDVPGRTYLLADRTAGGILVVDISTFPPTLIKTLTPPAGDPFAGINCDGNASFGGTAAAGRNEITGPNAPIVLGDLVFVSDAPSFACAAGQLPPCDFTGSRKQTNSASDYGGDNCDGNLRVFSMITGSQIAHINLASCFRQDEGAADLKSRVVVIAAPSEQPLPGSAQSSFTVPFVSFVSGEPADNFTVLAQFGFDGTGGLPNATNGIEQARWSPQTGLFYIAVPSDGSVTTGTPPVTSPDPNGAVAVFDARDRNNIKFVKKWTLTGGCSPNGLYILANEVFLGCAGSPVQVLDIHTGALKATVTGIGGGCDEVYGNSGDGHFVAACSGGTFAPGTPPNYAVGFVDVKEAGSPQFDKDILTAPGAHSVAADPLTVLDSKGKSHGPLDFVPGFGGACGTGVACLMVFGPTVSGGDDPALMANKGKH